MRDWLRFAWRFIKCAWIIVLVIVLSLGMAAASLIGSRRMVRRARVGWMLRREFDDDLMRYRGQGEGEMFRALGGFRDARWRRRGEAKE